jgi:indolepyruvate ferredoxin oxidoreductase beta subunit
VKKSEVHGMAQRGGSVVAHLRYGEKVYSPLIDPGSADIAVSFELLEALRYLPYYHKKTKVIVNTQKILPSPVSTGVDTYPTDVLEQLTSRGLSVFPVDAFKIAKSVGETSAVNMVLVGALSVFLNVDEKIFLEVIEERIPERIRRVNREAFLKGREIIQAGSLQQKRR